MYREVDGYGLHDAINSWNLQEIKSIYLVTNTRIFQKINTFNNPEDNAEFCDNMYADLFISMEK